MSRMVRRGDVVLVERMAQGWISASIAVGARLRYGPGSPHADYTHCAIVYDAPEPEPRRPQDPHGIRIAEATAKSGVHTAFLGKYAGQAKIVHLGIGDHDWHEVREFLDAVLEARAGYGTLTYVGLTLYALTGTRLCLQEAGTATCSGLVCDALTRAGIVWPRPPYACTPADIDAELGERFPTSRLAPYPPRSAAARPRSPARPRSSATASAAAASPPARD